MTDSAIIAQQNISAVQASKAAPSFGHVKTAEQAQKIAQDFEAFFLGQMLQPMFENINAAPPFGGGHAEKIWQGLMVDEYGKSMAKAGGIGIADVVMREILEMQGIEQ